MLEREKQRTDQEKKHQAEKQRRSKKKSEGHVEQHEAGRATNRESMKDKGYVERIEEKTEKH